QNYLAAEASLRRASLWMTDVPDALRLIPLLEALPQSWTWKQANEAMRAVVYALRHGINCDDLGRFLAFHYALEQSGINEQYVVDLEAALEDAGIEGSGKKKTLNRLITQARQELDIDDLTQQAHSLTAEIGHLESQRQKLRKNIEEAQRRIE